MRLTRHAVLMTAMTAGLAAAACASREAPTVERDTHAGRFLNGRFLNGTFLNGTFLNGTFLNGTFLNGRFLNGTYLNGTFLNGTTLEGTVLEGQDFEGAVLFGTDGNGREVVLYIEQVVKWADDPNDDPSDDTDDVMLYRIWGTASDPVAPDKDVALKAETAWNKAPADPAPVEWQNICGEDGWAIPVAGRWDYDTGAKVSSAPDAITFACLNLGAIGKCVQYGYKPWVGGVDWSEEEHHQACTRMLRADYCGDGTSWTADGMRVNVYDSFGINLDSEDWNDEAEWDANGAWCVSARRLDQIQQWIAVNLGDKDGVFELTDVPPTCVDDFVPCAGNSGQFDRGALLMTEVPSAELDGLDDIGFVDLKQ